jgi:phenylacetate-CoA ligase
MHKDSYDSLETRSTQERDDANLQALIHQIKEIKKTSPYWSNALASYNEDSLTSLSGLVDIPMLAKSSLLQIQEEHPPFGDLIPSHNNDVRRVFYSPGPLTEPQLSRETDPWNMARALYAANFRKGDIVANCFSYHLTPAGFMFDEAADAIGCTVFPAGVGNVDTLVDAFRHLNVNAYMGTPDFLKVIIERAEVRGEKMNKITKASVSGGPLFPETRHWYRDRGIQTLQSYGTAELGLVAFETDDGKDGMVVNENCIVEIVQPGTCKPVEDGIVGEVVVTTFNNGYPLIRFATGDLSTFISGSDDLDSSENKYTNKRLKGWLGRADQTTKVRGMFVHPRQVARVADQFPTIKKVRVEVSESNGNDDMVFVCESSEKSQTLENKLKDAIRSECRLRGEVSFVDFNSLPNDGKVIDDKRQINI